jgi:hypothetical protein
MHAEAHHLGAEAGFEAVFANDILIDRARVQMAIKAAGPIVCHRPEKSSFQIVPMSYERQIIFNQALGSCIDRNKANFRPLAFDAEMHDTLTAVEVFYS